MAKRRKRTNANVPAKGRLRDMADRLWSMAVRHDWNSKCAVCGAGKCEAHPLIPRQHKGTRYALLNGIALCTRHHKYCPDVAPHQNAAGWISWLEENQPTRAEWYFNALESGLYLFEGTATADYYCGEIRRLKQYVDDDDYTRIVGVKFGEWLEEQDNE